MRVGEVEMNRIRRGGEMGGVEVSRDDYGFEKERIGRRCRDRMGRRYKKGGGWEAGVYKRQQVV